ncbi:MAG: hypothetical protein ACRETX_16340 [Steroidobacteraceae bacterium]
MTERSLANLRPAWSSDTAPRTGGAWPTWRRDLRQQIGDGGELFGALAKLARGEAIAVLGPDGRPLIEPETNRPVVLVPSPAVVLGAIRELLDRAFGKPVQAIIDARDPQDSSGRSAVPMDEYTPEERADLLRIAHQRMLRAPRSKT